MRSRHTPASDNKYSDTLVETRNETYKIYLLEEGLDIQKSSILTLLELAQNCLPRTETSIRQFLKKIEPYKNDPSVKTWLKQNKFIPQIKVAKLSREEKAFEHALECFYQTLQQENIINFYSSSQHPIKGNALLSKNAQTQEGIEYKKDCGLFSDTQQKENNVVFAYAAAEIPEPLQAEKDGLKTYVFSGKAVSENCFYFVRQEDLSAFYISKPGLILQSHLVGSVYLQQETRNVNGTLVKITKVVSPNGKNYLISDSQNTQIATETTIFDYAALETIKLIRVIHLADPASAKELLKVFYLSTKSSYQLTQQRIAQAKKLCTLTHRYETAIVQRLPFAVKKNDIVKPLLKIVYEADGKERKAFLQAVQDGNVSQVSKLLENNFKQADRYSVDSKDNAGFKVPLFKNPFLINARLTFEGLTVTPLTFAIRIKNKEMINLLLLNGASVYEREESTSLQIGRNYGYDALMVAAELGDLETVKLLVEKYGANLGALKNSSIIPSKNDNALSLARKKGHQDVANYLISRGARNVDGSLPQKFNGAGLVLNAHGSKTNRTFNLNDLGHTLITPRDLSKDYTFSLDTNENQLEKDLFTMKSHHGLSPLMDSAWVYYQDEKNIPDVDLEPWKDTELSTLALRVNDNPRLWEEIDGQKGLYLTRDPDACLVLKAKTSPYYRFLKGEECRNYFKQIVDDYFERRNENYTVKGKLTLSNTAGENNLFPEKTLIGLYGTLTVKNNGEWIYTASKTQSPLKLLESGNILIDNFKIGDQSNKEQSLQFSFIGTDTTPQIYAFWNAGIVQDYQVTENNLPAAINDDALLFYAPKVKKLKILAPTSLQEILTCLKILGLQETVVLATCNAGTNPTKISLLKEAENALVAGSSFDMLNTVKDTKTVNSQPSNLEAKKNQPIDTKGNSTIVYQENNSQTLFGKSLNPGKIKDTTNYKAFKSDDCEYKP